MELSEAAKEPECSLVNSQRNYIVSAFHSIFGLSSVSSSYSYNKYIQISQIFLFLSLFSLCRVTTGAPKCFPSSTKSVIITFKKYLFFIFDRLMTSIFYSFLVWAHMDPRLAVSECLKVSLNVSQIFYIKLKKQFLNNTNMNLSSSYAKAVRTRRSASEKPLWTQAEYSAGRTALYLSTQRYMAILPGTDTIPQAQWTTIIQSKLSEKCQASENYSLEFNSQDIYIDGYEVERQIIVLNIGAKYEDQIKGSITATASNVISSYSKCESIRFFIIVPKDTAPNPIQIFSKYLQPAYACRQYLNVPSDHHFAQLSTIFLSSYYPTASHLLSYRTLGQPGIIIEVLFKTEAVMKAAIIQSAFSPVRLPQGGRKAAALKISRVPKSAKSSVELQNIRILAKERAENSLPSQQNDFLSSGLPQQTESSATFLFQDDLNRLSQQAQTATSLLDRALETATPTEALERMQVDQAETAHNEGISVTHLIFRINSIIVLIFGIAIDLLHSLINIIPINITDQLQIRMEKFAGIQYIIDPSTPTHTNKEVKIGHLNVNSIYSHQQISRRHLLASYIDSHNYDIFGITEHWTPSYKTLKAYMSTCILKNTHTIFSDHDEKRYVFKDFIGRGTGIILSLNLVPYIHEHIKIPGHLTGLVLQLPTRPVFICCIYMPSNNSPLSLVIFGQIRRIFQSLPSNTEKILMGDFNTYTEMLDHHQHKVRDPSPNRAFLTYLKNKSMIDTFRFINPHKVQYSYREISRIDYFWISESLIPRFFLISRLFINKLLLIQ